MRQHLQGEEETSAENDEEQPGGRKKTRRMLRKTGRRISRGQAFQWHPKVASGQGKEGQEEVEKASIGFLKKEITGDGLGTESDAGWGQEVAWGEVGRMQTAQ